MRRPFILIYPFFLFLLFHGSSGRAQDIPAAQAGVHFAAHPQEAGHPSPAQAQTHRSASIAPQLLRGPGAQTRPPQSLEAYEDSLAVLAEKIMKASFSPERIEANYKFIRTLVEALKLPGSYEYPFEKVKNMRILHAGDDAFRIMSWYVDRGESEPRFYGAIQMKSRELKLFGLVDHSGEIENPAQQELSYKNWFGAYYYEIIPVKSGGQDYHVLLGWKGENARVSGRVIEVLHFRGGEPVFGLPVFQSGEGLSHRIFFRYSARASMMLRYLEDKRTIVFDHLVPLAAEHEGNFEFYGPDLSYDGYRLTGGSWTKVENLELENKKGLSDDLFNDPAKLRINKGTP